MPSGTPEGGACYSGRGPHNAPYVIAIPENWNGTLFLQNWGATPADLSSSAALGPGRRLMPYGAAVAASNYRAATEAQTVIADESAEDACEPTVGFRQVSQKSEPDGGLAVPFFKKGPCAFPWSNTGVASERFFNKTN